MGGLYDPKCLLVPVGLRGPVDYTVVNGRVTVREGRLVTVDEPVLAEKARACCDAYLART